MLMPPIAGESALCLRGSCEGLTVGFSAMPNAIDGDRPEIVVDRKEYAIVTNTQSVFLSASGEFFDLCGPWVACEQRNALKDETAVGRRKRPQVFLDSGVVEKAVHALDETLPLQALQQLRMADDATAAANRLSEDGHIGSVFQQVEQFLVIGKRQHDGFRLAVLIDEKLIEFHLDGHDAPSLS